MEVSKSRVDVDGDGASSGVFQGICMIGDLAGGHGVGVRPGEGVRIRILLPPGTHYAYLQNVTPVKEEHEILLPVVLNSRSSVMALIRIMSVMSMRYSYRTANREERWAYGWGL